MSKLIIIEGLDGSGKSTQTALVEKYFEEQNIDYKKIKLPDYDSPSSTLVKMYLGGEFGKNADDVNAYAAGAFYAVDRFASYKLDWGRNYENGTVILADRYATSNSIYQMEKLDEKDWDSFLDWSADFEYNKIGIPKPDLVIFLDMPVEISQRLMTSRYNGDENKKDVHEANVDFLNRCRRSALYTAEKQGWAVIPCSDGEKPLPVEEIHNTVIEFIKKELKNA
ncbi:MAG: deoxynucleoside kinase [Eubacteriales bacterium]|nr:deoxynucleoside kinase [Eubacteriales bacterium]